MSTWCQHQCRPSAGTGGGGHTDIHTYGLSDQPSRVLEFHMLYGTKNLSIRNVRSSSSQSNNKKKPGKKSEKWVRYHFSSHLIRGKCYTKVAVSKVLPRDNYRLIKLLNEGLEINLIWPERQLDSNELIYSHLSLEMYFKSDWWDCRDWNSG